MTRLLALGLFAMALAVVAPARSDVPKVPERVEENWKYAVGTRLRAYGHRNWVVVADAAFPMPAKGGVELVLAKGDPLTILEFVLTECGEQKHVRPKVYTAAELPFVDAKDAPDIEAYRTELKKLFGERKTTAVPHEELRAKLDAAAEKHHVLVLKTKTLLPYSSVFIELECGYWTPEAEARLREAMKAPKE